MTTGREIQRVAVIGTGLMGHGIAQAFAVKGYQVNLLSRSNHSLKKAVQEIRCLLIDNKLHPGKKKTDRIRSRVEDLLKQAW